MTNIQKKHLHRIDSLTKKLKQEVTGKSSHGVLAGSINQLSVLSRQLEACVWRGGWRKPEERRFVERLQLRIRRVGRLIDLGAPHILIELEIGKLEQAAKEVAIMLNGRIPVLSIEQQRDIVLTETRLISNDPLESIHDRYYVLNEHYLGYRLRGK